jgi:hypothetical protein
MEKEGKGRTAQQHTSQQREAARQNMLLGVTLGRVGMEGAGSKTIITNG